MPNHWHFVLWPRRDGELTPLAARIGDGGRACAIIDVAAALSAQLDLAREGIMQLDFENNRSNGGGVDRISILMYTTGS